MQLKLTNNAETTIAGAVGLSDTTLLLNPGTGAIFPVLTGNDFFPITLVKSSGGIAAREIVYVTARNGDTCTIMRAQEGTGATTFSAGDYAGCHITAGVMASKADITGATFTGSVDVSGQSLKHAVLSNCAEAYNDNLSSNLIDISKGRAQRYAPTTGAQTLVLSNWPAAGTHGELLLYGQNLGAATITIDGAPVKFVNSDGTFTSSNSLNSNHGAALQSNGMDFILFWTPDGGANRFCKVLR